MRFFHIIIVWIILSFIFPSMGGFSKYEGIPDVLDEPAEAFRAGVTLVVDQRGGGDYDNIQDGINNASAGDTVFVKNGVYKEGVYLNRSITLMGEGNAGTVIEDGFIPLAIGADDCSVKEINIHERQEI